MLFQEKSGIEKLFPKAVLFERFNQTPSEKAVTIVCHFVSDFHRSSSRAGWCLAMSLGRVAECAIIYLQ